MKPSFSLHQLLLLSTAAFAPFIANAQDSEQPVVDPSTIDDRIVVRGRNIPEPQRVTSQVASFLSAEDLARTGDDNAALALTRLSGLSIVGGKFAFVRGLGDRYSSARLNGSPLPSPEPLRRTVPLDLFPSNILQGATVQKTFSPNYPGEFGGGVIDLETLRDPGEPFLNVKFGVGANLVTTGHSGLFVRGGDLDWLGYDDGLRSVPGPLQSAIDSGVELEDLLPADQEAVGESLVNSPLSVIQEGTVGPNFEATIDGGTAIDFNNGDMTLGITGVLGYKQDWTTEESIRQLADTQKLGIDATQTETSLDVTVNGLLSSALEWDDHLIQLTGLYIHSTTKEAQITEGDSFNLGQFITEQNIFLERALMMGQAAGEHALGDQFEINWRGAFARSTRDAPYERSFEDRIPDAAGVPTILPFTTLHSVNFSELTDDTWSGGVDLSWFAPIMGGREATVTIGYEYLDNDRDFISNPFQFITNTALPADVAQARVDFAYSPANIDPARFRLVDAGDDGVTSYDAELLVHGAFAQVDAELLPTLRATVGVRYEDAEESVDTFDRFGNDPAKDAFDSMLANDYWLPSAMVTWNFTDNMQFRLGYSHTIARPQFRELAASRFLDPETDRVYLGNPNLVDSEFRNYDARYEFYFGRNQFITLGGFYKEIKNPIEEIQSPLGDFNFQTSFINSPAAELLGGEFEYRTRFSIPWLDWTERRDWLFSVNYTYTNSEVKAGPGDLIIERDGTLTPGDTFGIDGSPMVGTPEHIVNAQFGWEGEHEQFTLLLGWVDERILARGERGNLANRLLDVIEEPGIQLDAVFRQFVEIAGTDVTIALTGRNLLGTKHKEQQRGTLAPEATNGITDFNTYERGRSISASVTAKF